MTVRQLTTLLTARKLATLLFVIAMSLALGGVSIARLHQAPTASAYVSTDQADYSPGSVVTISGDNSNGAGYAAGEAVHVDVSGPNNYTASCDATANGFGAWSCQVTLVSGDSAIGAYAYTATGKSSRASESGTFTDGNAPGSLDCPTLTKHNNTHYKLQVGATVTCTIDGATDVTGSTVTVYIKSSTLGNETVTGSVSGTTITFTYTARGDGCDTTNVAYDTVGNTANNDVIDDGVKNKSGTAAAGFAFVNSSGTVITCGSTKKDLTVSKTASTALTRTYAWTIKKSVDQSKQTIAAGGTATFNYTVEVTHDGGTDSDWQVNGTITVNNPNGFDVTGVNVTDAIDNTGSCSVTNGTNLTVPANKSAQVSYTCTYSSAPSKSSGTNTATATWPDIGSPHTNSQGTATYDFSNSTATVTVQNGTITVVDDKTDPTNPVTLGQASYTQANPIDFPYQLQLSGTGGACTDYTNTATIKETGQPASQKVTVCVAVDLTVTKDATPSFTRTYNWSIAKAVDKTLLDPGGTATYTVMATETGFTDSGWTVTGSIIVSNPNDFESIALTSVTDVVDNGGSCTVSGSTTATLAAKGSPGDSVTLSYSCTYPLSGPTSSSGTNTATASWSQKAASTPDGSAQGTKTFAFTTPTTRVNQTVTVTDTFAGTLGTTTNATDSAPFASQTFTYTRRFTPPASGCQTVDNTATIVETSQTASKSVQNCNSGALTMGFWKNTNGQKIITGGASTGGVCNSGTWLRQYAPFQDLSSTATCAQVATYVSNVISAATCSGTTQPCNAMLKAQMLATALDVYFSDPALGGNKISAPAPIGGVKIDLTSSSSAFGGATSRTVSQMLTDAASQSNVGGSTWYGNVKATQVLAKDAFDAINNQVAFAP
jgi:hypothetical protein